MPGCVVDTLGEGGCVLRWWSIGKLVRRLGGGGDNQLLRCAPALLHSKKDTWVLVQ